jgi:hypothetical protein
MPELLLMLKVPCACKAVTVLLRPCCMRPPRERARLLRLKAGWEEAPC